MQRVDHSTFIKNSGIQSPITSSYVSFKLSRRASEGRTQGNDLFVAAARTLFTALWRLATTLTIKEQHSKIWDYAMMAKSINYVRSKVYNYRWDTSLIVKCIVDL